MIRWLVALNLVLVPAIAMARPQPADLALRLQRIDDQLAIERVLVDYAAFLDVRDYASYASLFTPDGEWANGAGTHKGQAAIKKMLESVMGPAGAPNRTNYHIVTNPRIDLAGDSATATSRYVFMMRGAGGQPTPSLAGVYHDELVRQGGAWKIKRRVADDIMPTAEEWKKIIASHEGEK